MFKPLSSPTESRAGWSKSAAYVRVWLGVGTALLALALGSCSAGVPAPNPASAAATAATAVTNRAVYVAYPGGVHVYGPRAIRLITTITDGVDEPSALAFDRFGTLYVANAGDNTVSGYATGKSAPVRRYTNGVAKPVDLAAGASLYVLNTKGTGSVTIYSRSTGRLRQTITMGIHMPYELAVDPSNNLYVENNSRVGGSITVYPPGAASPSRSLSFGSVSSVQVVAGMAVDSRSTLYVGDTYIGEFGVGTSSSAVFAYPAGSSTPSRVLNPAAYSGGSDNAAVYKVEVDAADNLYVSVWTCTVSSSSSYCGAPFHGAVVEFGVHGTKPIRVIGSLIFPGPMAVDKAGNLYVVDCTDTACALNHSVMYVYAPGQTSPLRKLAIEGTHYAIALATAP